MRIKVIDGDTRLDLPLPTGLVLNRFTAEIAARAAADNGVNLTGAQVNALIRAAKDFKRSHPDWCLVEVESADGEYVMVRL